MSLYFFYTMVQKRKKRPKTQNKGGPALNGKQKLFLRSITKGKV